MQAILAGGGTLGLKAASQAAETHSILGRQDGSSRSGNCFIDTTGSDHIESEQKGTVTNDYVTKPVAAEALRGMVEKLAATGAAAASRRWLIGEYP